MSRFSSYFVCLEATEAQNWVSPPVFQKSTMFSKIEIKEKHFHRRKKSRSFSVWRRPQPSPWQKVKQIRICDWKKKIIKNVLGLRSNNYSILYSVSTLYNYVVMKKNQSPPMSSKIKSLYYASKCSLFGSFFHNFPSSI